MSISKPLLNFYLLQPFVMLIYNYYELMANIELKYSDLILLYEKIIISQYEKDEIFILEKFKEKYIKIHKNKMNKYLHDLIDILDIIEQDLKNRIDDIEKFEEIKLERKKTLQHAQIEWNKYNINSDRERCIKFNEIVEIIY